MVEGLTIYYSVDEAINDVKFPQDLAGSIIVGSDKISKFISDLVINQKKARKDAYLLAFDGFLGADWGRIVPAVNKFLKEKGLEVTIIDFSSYYKSPSQIEKMIHPFLSGDSSFGYVFKGKLDLFLNLRNIKYLKKKLKNCKKKSRDNSSKVIMSFGYGSAIPLLRRLYDQIFYFDLTREELFNQSEKHPIFFLGSKGQGPAVHEFLRRFYYVDSQALNKQKKYVLRYMNWYVECNFSSEPKLISKDTYYRILSLVAERPFRIKPLYYPVTWGGNWLKRVKNLPKTMPNSGQGCIVASENTIRIRVNNLLVLEIPFINLMWKESVKILGSHVSKKFHGEFPFTYWYDDGIEGGNMAIQVHPNNSYIREQFNEPIRQDESYYILHTGPEAVTYLGLKERANLHRFYKEAERAEKEGISLDYDKYVNSIPTKPGDFFLIPAGTVHASGRNQVVLEVDGGIAAYSPGYTFHIYDYLKPDLDGKLRPIHLKHAFNVIKNYRRANWVLTNLKQTLKLIRSGEDWAEYLLGRRDDVYYAVYRLVFTTKIEDDTKGGLTLLSLVEGDSVIVQSQSDPEKRYKLEFPDTLTVPACVGKFLITNSKGGTCKVVKASIK